MRLSWAIIFLLGACTSHAQDLTAVNEWTGFELNATNVKSITGADLIPYSSPAGIIEVSVVHGGPWTVAITRTDTSWHPKLTLEAIDSVSSTTIPVTNTPQAIYTGSGNDTRQISYRITPTVAVPPSNYSTTITFTVTTP